MKNYNLNFTKKGDAIFINESDKKDKIKASNILRFSTGWTRNKSEFSDCDGFFEDCNCFIQGGYHLFFFKLSECGEVLTNK